MSILNYLKKQLFRPPEEVESLTNEIYATNEPPHDIEENTVEPPVPFDLFAHYVVQEGESPEFDITAWDAVPYVVNAEGTPEQYRVVPGETQSVCVPLVLTEKDFADAAKELLIVAAGCRGDKIVDEASESVIEFDGWKIAIADPEHNLIAVEKNLACGLAVMNANAVRFLNVREKVDEIRKFLTAS